MIIFEQGDLLIFKEKEIPTGALEISEHILAMGEAHGHKHQLPKNQLGVGFQTLQHDNVIYLRVFKEVPLTHEEHERINLSPGEYRIGQVREKGMFDDMIALVVD